MSKASNFTFKIYIVLLFRLIEKSISSIYNTIHQAHLQKSSSSGASVDAMDTETSSANGSFIDLPKELFQMLSSAGPYLYRDTLLLQKVQSLVSYILHCVLSLVVFLVNTGGFVITFVTVGVSSVERVLLVGT